MKKEREKKRNSEKLGMDEGRWWEIIGTLTGQNAQAWRRRHRAKRKEDEVGEGPSHNSN